VHIELGRSQVEVQQCTLEKLEEEEDEEGRTTALIKSNNPHLAGGEKHISRVSWNYPT
jgi:hypothetical protein